MIKKIKVVVYWVNGGSDVFTGVSSIDSCSDGRGRHITFVDGTYIVLSFHNFKYYKVYKDE